MKTAWDAKLIITFVDQNLGHSGGPLIRSRKIYSEFAEHVSHDKDVLKPVPGGVQQGEIYGQYLIGSGGKQVAHKAVGNMSRVFCNLATFTLLDPALDIR
ncbi:hypothetical protein NQZ68_012414 [Dissostichus eleginoides]|nr:hypothetical protein NQZ68_012414 [Dissostichus eleginoides]